jgi:hypothetical protein
VSSVLDRAPHVASPRRPLSTRALVAWVCAVAVAVRLVYVAMPLRSDEGGYLFAARHWSTGGEFLYGDLHVDRPPLLMAIFRGAALSEWDGVIRVLAIGFVVVAIVATARAGYLLAGEPGARWAALVTAALLTSPALSADQADGELFAVPFVAASVAMALEAWRRPGKPAGFWFAVAAGVLGTAASLVKQNFLEGLVFAGTLVAADVLRRRRVSRGAVLFSGGLLAGTLLTHVAVLLWAGSAGIGGVRMWTDLAAFRADAFEVIWSGSTRAPLTRAAILVLLALVSAMVPLAWTWWRAWRERGVRDLGAEEWALGTSLVFGLVAIVAGGSYWSHYLLQSAVMLGLAAGVVAPRPSPAGAAMRRWARVAAVSAAVGAALLGVVYATVPGVWFQERTGEWLARSSAPGDTVLVTYGNPSILEAADLDTPYPYLWSLPMRTLDPDQSRLRATLAGPDAPTWIVQTAGLNSWDIDHDGLLRGLMESRYDVAATICGRPVWLRSDVQRVPASLPRC